MSVAILLEKALLDLFGIVVDALLEMHPAESLKIHIDAAAARRAEAAANAAEAAKFGEADD